MSVYFREAVRQVMLSPWVGVTPREDRPAVAPPKAPPCFNKNLYNGQQSRATVLAAIESSAGISVPEIVRSHNITIGKARGAAYRLEAAGLISRLDRGNGQFGYVRVKP